MVKRELFSIQEDGVKLYRTYSDKGYMLLQVETGVQYSEALDLESSSYTYEETDILIDGGDDDEISAEELKKMLEGVL